jgi:hypothetical protein
VRQGRFGLERVDRAEYRPRARQRDHGPGERRYFDVQRVQ